MKWKGWERIPLHISDNAGNTATKEVMAIAPLIISASRSTDIPAFYGDWFMARLAAGYLRWKSPFGGTPLYVSFLKARVFVFWSKNPAPFFHHLDTINDLGYGSFLLFTLNEYEREGLEPNIPPVDERVATFIRLSRRIGKGRVAWRYDPLVLSDQISVDNLLCKVRRIGNQIHPFTTRLIISFVDISRYGKVQQNLKKLGLSGVREFTDDEETEFCEGLVSLNKRWGLSISACGERRDLSKYGIMRGRCIDRDMMMREFAGDRILMEFLQAGKHTIISEVAARHLKDPGQRNTCGCVVSKDIGQYSTCMHLCAYCYANSFPAGVYKRYTRYLSDARKGIFHETILD